MDIFNISESPVLENVNRILEEGSKIKTVEQPKIKGNTKILKIMVGDTFHSTIFQIPNLTVN
jgi:hypothetical protein